MLLPAKTADFIARDGRVTPARKYLLSRDAPMNSRLVLVVAIVLSLPLAAALPPCARADSHSVSAFHGATTRGDLTPDARPTRYAVSTADYAWVDSQRRSRRPGKGLLS